MNKIFVKVIMLVVFAVIRNGEMKAQFVSIPDPNFVLWLTDNYPECMNGSLMDTTCISITSEIDLALNYLDISDLSGVEYFNSLNYLDCSYNNLTSLPPLPPSLESLLCYDNQLTELPTLPSNLIVLNCSQNNLTSLPLLPESLINIECAQNQLGTLPTLPSMLIYLECSDNLLTALPSLPESLESLLCNQNLLTVLPEFPQNLLILKCANNLITELPELSSSLQTFDCSFNLLIELPTLVPTLHVLICNNNQLTSLPTLTNLIYGLYCNNNQLTSLPPLLESFQWFNCSNNTISCFPLFPTNEGFSGFEFDISNNPATCLSNYIDVMDVETLLMPLCSINNENGCEESAEIGILGKIYEDLNADCELSSGDEGIGNIAIKLFNQITEESGLTSSTINGIYQFSENEGTYEISVDTLEKPYYVHCPFPGTDSTVVLTSENPLANDVNFDIKCKTSLDLNVQSINHLDGLIFPGQVHTLQVMVGDASQWYGLNCAEGTGGQVQITVDGPVSFNGIAPGALIPVVNGNVFTYDIADFGLINNSTDFRLLFLCDTTAQNDDQICIQAEVTPIIGDIIPSNNNLEYCYSVVNSYDPNYKEVYPIDVLPGFEDWFTYTIHFQNLGTAPAINIRVLDTLDQNLNLETLEVLNYSHELEMTMLNGIVNFRFPSIMLPDSFSDPMGSQGFVQYRIKPIANLEAGSQIENRGHIYFDYNPAVITNTTVNQFIVPQSVSLNQGNPPFNVYPNPSSGTITIDGFLMNEDHTVMLIDLSGKVLKTIYVKDVLQKQILLNDLANGIYTLIISSNNRRINFKLIINR